MITNTLSRVELSLALLRGSLQRLRLVIRARNSLKTKKRSSAQTVTRKRTSRNNEEDLRAFLFVRHRTFLRHCLLTLTVRLPNFTHRIFSDNKRKLTATLLLIVSMKRTLNTKKYNDNARNRQASRAYRRRRTDARIATIRKKSKDRKVHFNTYSRGLFRPLDRRRRTPCLAKRYTE